MSAERQNGSDGDTRQGQIDRRRRRLTTAAAASVPAFFVLRHRSVRAGECAAPSHTNIASSLSASGDHSQTQTCIGRSPGYWKNHPQAWPGNYEPGYPSVAETGEDAAGLTDAGATEPTFVVASSVSSQGGSEIVFEGGTRFFDVFLWAGHFPVPEATELTLMDVLRLPGNEDPQRMGAHFVAALLNAAGGLTEPLSVGQVQEMWRQWATLGYYSPPPGVDDWYAEDIKEYFATTWV